MKAIILIAGKGSRIRDHHELPKSMLEVNGETILSRTIRLLHQEGITDITAVSGYMEDYIKERHPELTYVTNKIYDSTNTLVSFIMGATSTRFEDDIILINGDLVLEEDAIKKIMESPNRNTFAVRGVDPTEEEVKVTLNLENHVIAIGKWVSSDLEAIGLYRISKEFAEDAVLSVPMMRDIYLKYYEDAFANVLVDHKVSVVGVDGVEVDTWTDYQDAKEEFGE